MNRSTSYKLLLDLDTSLCIKVNGLSGKKIIDKLSYIVSKLGDGSIYFAFLAIFIIIFNKAVLITARDYLVAGGINLIFYKLVKNKVKRVRPYTAHESINKLMPPPDEFSFPSGHSGAAAVFCYCTFYHMPVIPALSSAIWMILIGFSRVYNGVHYPGDVFAGYFMGTVTAKIVLYFFYFN